MIDSEVFHGYSASMSLTDVFNTIGTVTILSTLVYIGKKLQVLSDLQRTMSKVKNNLKVIADALITAKIDFDHSRIESYSPLRLTEEGAKYLRDIGFFKLFEEHGEDFFDCIEEDRPQTPYDVEKAAMRSIFFLFDQPYFYEIKDFLYQNPRESKKELMQVAGIYVRDQYLKYKWEDPTKSV